MYVTHGNHCTGPQVNGSHISQFGTLVPQHATLWRNFVLKLCRKDPSVYRLSTLLEIEVIN